jgi:transcriptional regulator with XRE-family HTH domain
MESATDTPHFLGLTDRQALELLVNRVRSHRLHRNWTQVEMARRCGLGVATYQNFENGSGNLTLFNLTRVLGILGFSAHLAELVPPVLAEPTLKSLLQPVRQRARVRAPKK